MGYVKFTEKLGDISKTYEFESCEDFKDWENGKGLFTETDSWVENTGEYPPPYLDEWSEVEVKFKNDRTSIGPVVDFFGWNQERKKEYSGKDEWFITHYRVVSK